MSLRHAVLAVSSHAQLGGAEGYLELLLDGLPTGAVSRVVLLEDGPFAERVGRKHPAAIIPSRGKPAMLLAALRLRRLIAETRPRVVLANGIKAALIAVLATRGRGVPVVWRKVDGSGDGRLARWIARRCLRVVANSGATAAAVQDIGPPRVAVIYNGVPAHHGDRADDRTRLLEATGFAADARIVLLAGRLHPEKGQLELIEALPEIVASEPAVRVAFAGAADASQPGFEELMRARLGALGLAGHVRFLGRREDAPALLGGADVAVVPSVRDPRSGWQEGFGRVAAEAMAAGTPVVAYRHGSLPEVLGDAALLADEGDRAGLAEAVVRVLGDGELAARLGAAGRARVTERFDLDRALGAWRVVLAEAAEAGR